MQIRTLIIVVLFFFSSMAFAVEIEATLSWAGYQKHSFPVGGVVDKVAVSVGKKVNKGEFLAQLLDSPFKYNIKKCKAKLNQLTAPLLDAKVELEQAEELFERTVLSEIELQNINGKYKSLLEHQNELKAECLLQNLNFDLSILKSKDMAYVLSSNIDLGMVISNENKALVYMELVSAKKASAITWLSFAQKNALNIGEELKVLIDDQEFPAKIESIDLQGNDENKYKIVAEFYYTKLIEPGKNIKIKIKIKY